MAFLHSLRSLFPRDIFRYLIRMEEMRQSLKIIEQVSVQMKRESTDTSISECDLPS